MTLLTRAMSLLLAAPLLPVALAAAPAEAGVQPCTVSYTNTGGAIVSNTTVPVPPEGQDKRHTLTAIEIQVADSRVVTDIHVSADLKHPDAAGLAVFLISPQTRGLAPNMLAMNVNQASGLMDGAYSYDEESGAGGIAGANPDSGTYRPVTAESILEGHPGTGKWSLWVNNYSASAGTLRSFTVTLTYATCDSDGDGVEDSVDNCPAVANDQANQDADSVGDACDLDIDGDSLANTVDGCPLVSAATTSGCPKARRTAKIGVTKAGKRLKFMVRSRASGCVSGAEFTLWRARRGKDIKVMAATTTKRGRYTTKAPRQAGKYYFRVTESYAAGEAECGRATSRSRKIRRRS